MALCPPAVTTEDGGTYRANAGQLEIWRVWTHFWDEVKRLRGAGRKRRTLYVIINGEIIDGDHHNTTQLITRNCVTQLGIAILAFEPVFNLKPDHIFMIRGTPAHSGENGQWDEAFARDIRAEKDQLSGTHSWWWLPLEVEGILFDIAHHGRSGYRPWTVHNAPNMLAAQIMMDYAAKGDRIPDLALRGHVHKALDSWDNYPVRVLNNPSWQFSTGYGQRIAPGEILPIGGNIILIDGADYEVKKIHFRPKRRKPWANST